MLLWLKRIKFNQGREVFFIMRSLDLLSEGATAELNSETLCFRVVALAGP